MDLSNFESLSNSRSSEPSADPLCTSGFGPEAQDIRDAQSKIPGPKQLIRIPVGYSPDFAYVLGAFAATVRAKRSDGQVSFANKEEPPLTRLCSALHTSCNYQAHILQHQIRGTSFPLVAISSPSLVTALGEQTNWNQRTPWERLLTRNERLKFLEGFFDFAGGSLAEKAGRLCLTRGDNNLSLVGVGILLKKVGVIPRVTLESKTYIFIEDINELRNLYQLGVVRNDHLGIPLKNVALSDRSSNDARAEQYFKVMEKVAQMRQSREETRSPIYASEVLHALGEEGGIPMKRLVQTQRWIEGQVPRPVQRLRDLEILEKLILSDEAVRLVGQALLQRIESESVSAKTILKGVLEWHGSVAEISRVTKLAPALIQGIFDGSTKLAPKDYYSILRASGIDPVKDLGLMTRPPTSEDLISWIPKNKRGVYYAYSGAFLRTAREAFYECEDPNKKVMHKLAELTKKRSFDSYGTQY